MGEIRDSEETIEKVVAIVTRGRGEDRELLVFRHPTSGVQLPAGTVETGEAVEAALLREIREETGLSPARIMALLTILEYSLPESDAAVLRTVPLREGPGHDAEPTGVSARRGMVFQVAGQEKGFARLACGEAGMSGPAWAWIPADALTRRLRRHLYHVEPATETPENWTVRQAEADLNLDFHLYWVPLAGEPGLVPPQDGWLAAARRFL